MRLEEGDFEGAIARGRATLAVSCPSCGAAAGLSCRRPSEHRTSDFHGERRIEADRAFFRIYGPSTFIGPDGRTIHAGPETPELPEGWESDLAAAQAAADLLHVPGRSGRARHDLAILVRLVREDLELRGVPAMPDNLTEKPEMTP
ncbi:hypothetical protein LAZ40_02220 [Cereibacter sphaeroides]|uniref:zinc finger domain-containing protein n=1 Tax=Cereibacter sphaeroides TaxID=1063 RepID=UPI001F240CAE|nr:hypothetical protein [Cereibacter sphaeroides]MCE6957873.1 hypothetical protein [Cereibacter sphaeroides]MCE6971842.1 hypothetical protein [Cereibacter sphaeroides]